MKKMKRIIAFWLTLIMLFAMFPGVVSAAPPNPGAPANERPWRQRPVSESTIVVGPASGGTVYNLNIMWSRPHLSTILDLRVPVARLQAAADAGFWTIFPTSYMLNFRNATINESFGENPSLQPFSVPAPPNSQSRTLPPGTRLEVSTGARNFNMRPASLYEIRIDPIRPIPIELPVPDGSPPGTIPALSSENALIDNSPGLPIGRDLLFLTDITPTADGRSNVITVTWENPTWGGVNIFPYWQISHRVYQPGLAPGAWNARPPMPVGGTTASPGQIQQNPDGTLTAVIHDPTLRTIGNYQVRVEPMLGPNPANSNHRVRQGQTYARIDSVPDRNFDLYFTENDYSTIATMVPQLNLEQVGAEFIRVWWPPLTPIFDRITHLVIEEWPESMEGMVPDSEAGRIGTVVMLPGMQAEVTEYLIGPGIPRERRAFSLAIHLRNPDEVIRTEIVVYDPLVADFRPYRPEIVRLDHVGDGRLSMEWLAFARFPAVPAEAASIPEGDPYRGRFVDTALYYEIFVSDSWSDMAMMTTPLFTIAPGQLERSHVISPVPPAIDPTWQLFPFDFITQYQSRTDGGIEIRDIQGNRVYFVRIRAVRYPGGQTSDWAYGSVFVPPLAPLEITPEMIASPPVEIVQSGITENSIPLRWDIRYLEIMQPYGFATAPDVSEPVNPVPDRDVWHTVVGVNRDDNRMIFGRSAAHINYLMGNPAEPGALPRHEFLNRMLTDAHRERLLGLEEFPMNPNLPAQIAPFLTEARNQVQAFLSGNWNLPNPSVPPITLRVQDTYTFNYEIFAVPYAIVRQFPGGFDNFRDNGINPALWESIGRPTITDGVANFTVEGLTENTVYVIFIRPYVTIGGRHIPAAYPTFVIGTTVVTPDRPVPDPTTPILHEVPRYTTRNRVAVRWRVQSDMIYEVRISHFFTDFPNGGTVIPITFEDITAALNGETVELEDPRSILDVQEVEVNGVMIPYFHLRITERFPDTQYYIWARAVGVDRDGNIATAPSAPSNPVDIRTHDIEPPPPPRSFGRTPSNLIALYNRYHETTYRHDEPYAMNLSWMRIFADLRDDAGNLVERADAGTGDAGIRPMNLPNLSVTEAYVALHILRFEGLVANRRYYARARTILTVQRGGPDIYSYEVQLADNEDFLDAMTFIIPPLIPMDPINTRRASSEWVYVEVDTGVTDDEFDGPHRPDQYPLPERDWEITYCPITQTLTWRFRTNQRGADGRLDQNVDQRFISRLINERAFVFTADMSSYEGLPIANREIILPESIIRAFQSELIRFDILAGEKNISIPPGAFDTAQTRDALPGVGSYYTISLFATENMLPPLVTNTQFATVPMRMTVAVETPARTVNLTAFARPIGVTLPIEPQMAPEGLNTGLFV
ncbi:MAG: hypothetical protein FWF79_02960, partial [Defluviitaleaceae bacterium]|nr:hypothetical protein [Defluviitaleaceae bacterium]